MEASNAKGYPSRREAEELLQWAGSLNPGPWTEHSRVAARVAETIASAACLDADQAFVLGLLHDIGRYEGVFDLHHVIAGYKLMMEKGYAVSARICITHSFPYQRFSAYGGKTFDCSKEEQETISNILERTVYDVYDELIQLSDAMSLPQGVALIDSRLVDVALRYGVDDFTTLNWRAFYALKAKFDQRCGCNVYAFFKSEIQQGLFL